MRLLLNSCFAAVYRSAHQKTVMFLLCALIHQNKIISRQEKLAFLVYLYSEQTVVSCYITDINTNDTEKTTLYIQRQKIVDIIYI